MTIFDEENNIRAINIGAYSLRWLDGIPRRKLNENQIYICMESFDCHNFRLRFSQLSMQKSQQ